MPAKTVYRVLRSLLSILAIVFLPGAVPAHPISMSSAAATVREDTVRVNMKIMLEDLVMYHELEASEDHRFRRIELMETAERHRSFLLDFFSVYDSDGRRVPGKIVRVDTSMIPAEGVEQSELMAITVVYHMEHPLPARQAHLTFVQTFGGDGAVLPAVMELVVFQNDIMAQRPVQLAQGMPHSVAIDWENPAAPVPLRADEYRRKRNAEFHQKLGITSYSGLYSFIYITDGEVRHEILVPLLTLERWLPLVRADPDFMDLSEQEASRAGIASFFGEHNPVVIDGLPVRPVLDRLQYFGLDIRDFARDAAPRRISVYQARVGIILSYPSNGPARTVEMIWETFGNYAPFLRSIVYIGDRDARMHHFYEDQPRFKWTRENGEGHMNTVSIPRPKRVAATLSLPLVSLGAFLAALTGAGILIFRRTRISRRRWTAAILVLLIAGVLCLPVGRIVVPSPFSTSPQLTREETDALSLALLRSIYNAFDKKSESDIYDTLAENVDGELLHELYFQIQKGLKLREQGGAVASVKEIALIDNKTVSIDTRRGRPARLKLQSRWRVTGTVEHWGHIHTRENEYEAVFILTTRSEAWKITGYEILDEHRVPVKTRVRKLKDDA